MSDKNHLEEKVLEYWFALEFLGQDKYPHKELVDAFNGVKDLKAKLSKGQKGYKSTFDFFEIDPQNNLFQMIQQEAEQCHMNKWGNITVYIGKVKREACIECIAQQLSFENGNNERPEKSFDDIACVSLQLSPDGKYIEHSLSLSTIIWAMKQVKNCNGKMVDCLEENEYKAALEEMEKAFFSDKNTQKIKSIDAISDMETEGTDVCKKEISKTNSKNLMQEFDRDAVQLTVFERIYSYVEKTYLIDNVEQIDGEYPYELVIGISFQMFADEDTKTKEEDDNYLGLSHDYFSDDLKMILDKIRYENVPEYVLNYISSTSLTIKNSEERERVDLIHPSDQKLFERQVLEILNIRNAPIGKWPSRFMPAFMQQIAINLAIKKGTSDLFGKNGEVFSVNGPPGTGKTTLLKEIVVNNIIERAILLASYDNPDAAFDEHSFIHGSKQNGAYSQYTRHWYSFKEDRINDYGVLVTSCNNAAVENISKELPLGSGILKDLKPSDEDAEAVKTALTEVSELFDPLKSIDIESYERNSVECPDIYFTYYAQKLLKEKSAWGLIAASLGKKKNIRDFYQAVLSPLKWDFYPAKESAANRISKYKEAKEKFLAQEKLVREMQEQIAHICDLACIRSELKRKILQLEEECNDYSLISKSRKPEIEKRNNEIQVKISAKTEEKILILDQKQALDEKIIILESQRREGESIVGMLHQKSLESVNSVGKRPRFFGKDEYDKKLRYAQKVAEDFDKQAEKQSVKNEELSVEIQKIRIKCNIIISRMGNLEKELTDLNVEMKKLDAEALEINNSLQDKMRTLEKTNEELEEANTKYVDLLKNINDGKELTTEFIGELLSEDNDVSTDAQVTNPWFTMRYNREREKLFYYAMKINKEFILSSKRCRDNFISLGHYWGLQLGDDKEKIVFHKEDREACVSALYQTLFLLVPVISTTFASVGTFLKDVKNSKSLGTLIVDEAGQAQPQMAVGALYRCRKAVIVGDPKQVEPVVTDDLRLLKKAFDDADLKPYTCSKTISVQSCADELNVFGTYLNNPDHPDYPDWIGCPLLVHRRCISPMYEISNVLSYNGIMKQKTIQPSTNLEETFVYEKSQWIQIKGKEKGNRNHFVIAQADKVCEMLEIAFSKNEFPSLYIISPFTTVIFGIRSHLRTYKKSHPESTLSRSQKFDDWISKNIGTVHTFQGKEANEVIFLLGCDGSKDADGAVRWVNSNIVNVAVTRAKFRLYVIGDVSVWSGNSNLRMAKSIMDTFAIKEIHSIMANDEMSDISKADALNKAAQGLPSVSAFPVEKTMGEEGITDYSVDTDGLTAGLEAYSFMKNPLTPEQLNKFGFASQEEILRFSPKIRKNLELGMRLYYFLQPVYVVNKDFDASCCAILFCKAMELQIKECFKEGMQEYEIRGRGKGREKVKIKNAHEKELTLGTFQHIIQTNYDDLSTRMKRLNEFRYDSDWWQKFGQKLSDCVSMRNKCCHDGLFEWKHLSKLLACMFRESGDMIRLAGLMFESEAGKYLKS